MDGHAAMEIDVKTFVAAFGLAAVLAGHALAQGRALGASMTAAPGAPASQTGTPLVQQPAMPAPAGGFSRAAASADEPKYPSTAEPSSPHTSWQFGPWLGRYPEGQ